MRALVKTSAGVRLEEVAWPVAAGPNDVRLRVLAAGVCRTDRLAAQGAVPLADGQILGHEFCGVVDQIGEGVQRVAPGDRAAVDPFFPCGACPACRRGDRSICPDAKFLGVDLPGAFAEAVVVPEAAVHRLPAGLDPRAGAYAEPVAAALALLQLEAPPDARGVLLGKNRFSRLAERILTLFGRRPPEVWEEAEAAAAPPHLWDYAVECRPSAALLAACIRGLRPGGTLVLKSRSVAPTPLVLGDLVRKGLRVQALHYGPFDAAVELLAEGRLDVSDLLGRTLPLEAGVAALAADEAEDDKTFLVP